ncbi:hypothetical protein QBC43DRAFT_306402 [Cladorrhinum sp. PSN259]|nr:hypothetical protein QBC43DRAFT_306402 [Cladorrhinum sp. PSN259]
MTRSSVLGSIREEEQQPLLGGREMGSQQLQQKSSRLARWRKHFTVDVNREWGDCVLILCYLITGLLDSASISVWGSFVSMQTGNTVYIGLGLSAPYQSTRWIKSGTSLISFCVGSFLFSRFHRFFSPKRRWVLCASFTIQLLLTSAAAAIVTLAGVPADMEEIDWRVLIPIALVAFQSCGQAVTSRALQYNALTSVVLTSIYCDLFSDQELFALRNAEPFVCNLRIPCFETRIATYFGIWQFILKHQTALSILQVTVYTGHLWISSKAGNLRMTA